MHQTIKDISLLDDFYHRPFVVAVVTSTKELASDLIHKLASHFTDTASVDPQLLADSIETEALAAKINFVHVTSSRQTVWCDYIVSTIEDFTAHSYILPETKDSF